MPEERPPPDKPEAWIDRARSNLIRARHTFPKVYLEDLCFDAQQAAEKAIKALLIHLDTPFPFTHDLTDLLTRVERQDVSIPDKVCEASILTEYAVETRYPGATEPVTEGEHERAVEIAESVVRWVESHLETGGKPSDSRSDGGETIS